METLNSYLYIFPYITCVYYRVYIITFIYFLISHVSTIVFTLLPLYISLYYTSYINNHKYLIWLDNG
jgi:cytochrome c biogenesis protein CcdA